LLEGGILSGDMMKGKGERRWVPRPRAWCATT